MIRLLSLLRRALALQVRILAWLSIRDTERRLDALIRQHRYDRCPLAALANDIECERLSEELAAKRAAYVAKYMAPGQRLTFEVA